MARDGEMAFNGAHSPRQTFIQLSKQRSYIYSVPLFQSAEALFAARNLALLSAPRMRKPHKTGAPIRSIRRAMFYYFSLTNSI